MTDLKKMIVHLSLALLTVAAFSACGQKGPLIVERTTQSQQQVPQQIQKEETSETR